MGHMPCEQFGTLDEWLSQWSAKPCTAVRIRQVPRSTAIAVLSFFIELWPIIF